MHLGTIKLSARIMVKNKVQENKAKGVSSSPLRVYVNDVQILQLLEYVTGNRATAFTEMGWSASVPLTPTIYPPKTTNT